jgi:hypothetical protein
MPAGPNEFPAGKSRIAAFGRFIARMPPRARLIYAFLILLSLFLSNGRVIGQTDSIPASLLPVALLVGGSVTYDGIIEGLGRGEAPDGFVKTTHGLVSAYPIMTGLMALPIYAPVIAMMRLFASPSPEDWVKFAWRFQKLPAAVFATLAVLAFWRLCEALEFPRSLSTCLTLWLAFGSELFSVSAQSLWQHSPGMLAVIATVDAQVRLRNHPTTAQALVLSSFCGLAIAIRPTNVLIVGPFGLLGLMQQPRLWLPLLAPVATVLTLLTAYNLHFFGAELGGYAWAAGTIVIGNLAQGLPGLLFSPGRGLLIYFVVTAVAAAALALRPRTFTDPTAAAAVVGAVASFLLFSCFPWWWGGWSYGPRLLSEIEPLVLVLLGLAWREMDRPLRRALLAAAFGLLPFGILVQAVGVYSVAAVNWNGQPVNVDQAVSRLWDVADNPIFRGLHISSSR